MEITGANRNLFGVLLVLMTSTSTLNAEKMVQDKMIFERRNSTIIPKTTDGLYEISEKAQNGLHTLKWYFTPLRVRTRNNSYFNVVYSIKAMGKVVHVPHSYYFAKIDIPVDEVTNITLRVINSAGMSKETRTLRYFPKELVPRPSRFSIIRSAKGKDCFFEAAISQTDYYTKFSHLFHTIVWCRGNLTSCKEPLTWEVLENSTTKTQKYDCGTNLRYGLITLGYNNDIRQLTSGGIKWLLTDPGKDIMSCGKSVSNLEHSNTGTLATISVIMTFILLLLVLISFARLVIKRNRKISRWSRRLTVCKLSQRTEGEDQLLSDTRCTDLGYNRTEEFTWRHCIHQKNATLAANLLNENVIPTNDELQLFPASFGRCSFTTKAVCATICKHIEIKVEHNINVWPAYKVSSRQIVFVVESMMPLSNIQLNDFEILIKYDDSAKEKETRTIMLRERELLLNSMKDEDEKLIELKQAISKNASNLMNKHTNINAICPSIVKSTGYDSLHTHQLIEMPCISIYVEKKVRDLIPLEEDLIPAYIGGFPTDIVTGRFSFYTNGPNEYHRTMKMGCAIHAGVMNDNNALLGGTLGGFVQHKNTRIGLCCLTCAHFILSKAELQRLKQCTYIEYPEGRGKSVYQPVGAGSEAFGRVHAAAYKNGADGSTGVEVVLIKVLQREPTSGDFAKLSTGSDPCKDFVFNSGNVTDAQLLRPMTEVYKIGIGTGSTVGYLGLQGAVVRGRDNNIYDQSFGIELYNQLEIYPKYSSQAFAQIGDSGALVFIGHTRPNGAAAIGIVEGGFDNGKCLVTPLLDALDALKCPSFLKRFESSFYSGIGVNLTVGAEGGCGEEPMDYS